MKTKKNKAQKTSKLEAGIQNLVNEKEARVKKSKAILEKDKAEVPEVKDEKKSKKSKVKKAAVKRAEANLVEEVITKREVKYLYPEGCEDTLSRKKFRQQVRNKIHQLELAMRRIEDRDSKEFKKAEKEYKEYKNQFVKESVAV